MTNERFLLDTHFIQVLLNKRDQYHSKAQQFLPRLRAAREAWVTEAILVEVANGLSAINRQGIARFISHCYHTPNIHVVSVDSALFQQALALYEARQDKTWGLTDCISFVVMEKNNLTDAVTADRDFAQAG